MRRRLVEYPKRTLRGTFFRSNAFAPLPPDVSPYPHFSLANFGFGYLSFLRENAEYRDVKLISHEMGKYHEIYDTYYPSTQYDITLIPPMLIRKITITYLS